MCIFNLPGCDIIFKSPYVMICEIYVYLYIRYCSEKIKYFFIKQGCFELIKSDLSYHTISVSVSFALFIHETVN